MVYAYFEIDRRSVEEEEHGAKRATYGTQLLKKLSCYLMKNFGQGYSVGNHELPRTYVRGFTGTFPRF